MSAPTLALRRFRFARSSTDRPLTGAAAGLAERLCVDALAVRASFVLLALAGGAGIALYLVALALAEPAGAPARRNLVDKVDTPRRSWSWLCFTMALVVILRRAGLWLGDPIGWPMVAVIVGSLVVWLRRPNRSEDVRRFASTSGRASIVRIVLGLTVAAAGVGALSLSGGRTVGVGAAAGVALLLGVVVTAGPWMLHAGRELAEQQRERIRIAEMAAVSAHLHDSVLQTLTLIQRRADDPEAVARLARRQEHELRDWLSGRTGTVRERLREEIEHVARDVESIYGVTIEPVQVGDIALDSRLQALAEATREALVNAAKHAKVSTISLFVEQEPETTVVYVRDRGIGFYPQEVPADRVGIRESLVGRLSRVGGTAEITSAPCEGTEVELRLPRKPGDAT